MCVEYVCERTDEHRGDALGVQPFDEVTGKRVLCSLNGITILTDDVI